MQPELRVGTWNINLGMQLDRVLHGVASRPEFSNLDFLALQESSEENGVENTARIAQAMGDAYAYYHVGYETIIGRQQANAIIWNSDRVTVTNQSTKLLPSSGDAPLSRIEKQVLKTAMFPQKRNYIHIGGHIGEEQFRFYVTHLDTLGFVHKMQQATAVVEDIRQHENEDDLVFLAADMNTQNINRLPVWKKLGQTMENGSLVDVTHRIRKTHSFWLPQKLDYIYVRPKTKILYKSQTLPVRGSDHYPLLVTIKRDLPN